MGHRIFHVRVQWTEVSCTISVLDLQWGISCTYFLEWQSVNFQWLCVAEEELYCVRRMRSEGKKSSREMIHMGHWMQKISCEEKFTWKGRKEEKEASDTQKVKKISEYTAGQAVQLLLKHSSQVFIGFWPSRSTYKAPIQVSVILYVYCEPFPASLGNRVPLIAETNAWVMRHRCCILFVGKIN